MLLEIYSDNFTLIRKIEIEADVIPRTGELISLEQDSIEGEQELLVHNVSHVLKNNRLTAIVGCHIGSGSENRRFILKEHGWL